MSAADFEERRRQGWSELDEMIEGVEKRRPGTDAGQLPRRFREACADLALAQHRMYDGHLVGRLNDLVIRGYKLLYRSRRKGGEAFVRFVTRDFPAKVRDEWRLFWLCSAMFWVPFLSMLALVAADIDWAQAVLRPEGMAEMEQMYGGEEEQIAHLRELHGSNFMMFAFYIQNNVGIDFQIFAGGILACLGTVFFLVFNGVHLGAAAGYVNEACNPQSFWTFVSGHSSFELLGMVVAGMAGMRLGIGVLRPGRMSRSKSIGRAAREALPLIYGAGGMTALAAVVEGFWSAQPLPAELKYGFGFAMWGLHGAYFLLVGRGAREA